MSSAEPGGGGATGTYLGRLGRHPSPVRHPRRLGGWMALALGVAAIAIAVWGFAQHQSGLDLTTIASVGASAFATVAVGLLAIVAIVNFVAAFTRGVFLWVLPTNIRIPVGVAIPIAVIVGLVAGRVVWQ